MRNRRRSKLWRTSFLRVSAFCLTCNALTMIAQVKETEHTYQSQPGALPKATLQDVNWLQGAWEGPAFGGTSQELWSQPMGHAMVGVYRSVENGEVTFHEIMSLVETNGSLEMRLKHFHGDLTGWEEKDKVFKFPLVKVADGEVCFDGLTYKRAGPNDVTVYLAEKNKDGKTTEAVFQYHRKPM
jgi:hypothetical protein